MAATWNPPKRILRMRLGQAQTARTRDLGEIIGDPGLVPQGLWDGYSLQKGYKDMGYKAAQRDHMNLRLVRSALANRTKRISQQNADT